MGAISIAFFHLVWHFETLSVVESKAEKFQTFFENSSQNFGKIALCSVVDSERKIKRVWETSQQAKIARCRQTENGRFYGKGTLFLCLLRNFIFEKDGKGMERKRNIKDGQIVVKNPLYQELPKYEIVMKSGKTLYRFTGSYEGERSLPHKVLRLLEQESSKKDVE